jgi:hypothetical protein
MGIYPPPKLGHLRRCDVPQGDVVSIPAEGLLLGGEFVISDFLAPFGIGGGGHLMIKRHFRPFFFFETVRSRSVATNRPSEIWNIETCVQKVAP